MAAAGQKGSPEVNRIPRRIKTKLRPLVEELLNKCTSLETKPSWTEFCTLYEILEKIKDIETPFHPQFSDRKNNLQTFYDWCSQNGAEFSSIEISEMDENDYGVIAKQDIKEDEKILTVPRKLMLSELSAKNSKLGPLIEKDPILKNMSNVQVSMLLISEFLDSNSFWMPFISILPPSYNTILYFSLDQIKELKESSIADDVWTLTRSVMRQYCYFFMLFERDSIGKSVNIGQYFTYELYRWAVSTVMTRQNVVPSFDGNSQITALVPLFDMCNHANGKPSADFLLKIDALVSYAGKSFLQGNEVFIFYAPRRNAEFFVHNGFVYMENENDSYKLRLGISVKDPLYLLKKNVCEKIKIPSSGTFQLCSSKGDLVPKNLLMFLKIFNSKSDELQGVLNSAEGTAEEAIEQIPDGNLRAYSFLRERLKLLLSCFPTTLEEDEMSLQQTPHASAHRQLTLKYLISEKRILCATKDLCDEKISKLTLQQTPQLIKAD